ncbi:MAG: D-glycero-beta-D-manno-heptose 1-phosphate adenylyltransferase [Bdellovibrionaceae bacterium]|nr:D-glycero-beta-D-manno-heptose 1-phosphate adenylyltransferase [Bdellovibrionales bacterium]MCB9253063.1 D-glycero-beta-D-manno-heptose 1-phosphate adenylyltransferase [Pseudobdellovibrionaceae bacterium]
MCVQPEEKILPLAEIVSLCESWKSDGKRIVTTNGCFDLVHYGHARYLAAASRLGDRLICAVNSDASVRSLGKGSDRPLFPEQVRAYQVASLAVVDAVVVFSENTPEALLEALRPDIHVKGGDYRPEDLPETKVVERNGGEIQIIPLEPGYSTTAIFERIRKLN